MTIVRLLLADVRSDGFQSILAVTRIREDHNEEVPHSLILPAPRPHSDAILCIRIKKLYMELWYARMDGLEFVQPPLLAIIW